MVSLAKTLRMGLDKSQEKTTLPTATLELLLVTLIDYYESGNPTARNVMTQQAGAVAAHISEFGN